LTRFDRSRLSFHQPEAVGKLNPHFLLCLDTRRKHYTFYADERNVTRETRTLNKLACTAHEKLKVIFKNYILLQILKI
jgi:hypothetical protein